MPHINLVLRSFYKKYPESVEISLESVGESAAKTKPTILVICTSVHKVRSILKKSLVYDKATYGLKVCRGKVVRARNGGVKRSMAHGDELEAKNIQHQERPENGASMGAYINDHHLPPVSFGGLITVNEKPYGMSVHHMVDDPSDNDDEGIPPSQPILRSSARPQYLEMPELTHSDTSYCSSGDEEYNYSFTDYSSSDSSFDSESSPYASEDDDDSDGEFPTVLEPGDIPPIPVSPSNCHKYPITQPAIDDIDPDFYPDPETRDEDHLDSFSLGNVYTSSGIRRLVHENITHEIDWCLFEFENHRLPDISSTSLSKIPTGVVPLTDLPDLPVKCTARTSGTQTGRILPSMSILKIQGRKTSSMSWQVAGKIGVPGDSGAWVLERGDDVSAGPGNNSGRIAGSVLAWSQRKSVGYICPMWISILDIADVLKCERIGLPGVSTPVWSRLSVREEGDVILPIIRKKMGLTSKKVGGWDSEDEVERHILGTTRPHSGNYPTVIDDDLADDEDELSGVLGNMKNVDSDHKYDHQYLYANKHGNESDDESYDEEEEREYWRRFKAGSISPESTGTKRGGDHLADRFRDRESQPEKEVLLSSEEEPELLATLGQQSRRGRGFGVRTFSGDKSLDVDLIVGAFEGLGIDGMAGERSTDSDMDLGMGMNFERYGNGKGKEKGSSGLNMSSSGNMNIFSMDGTPIGEFTVEESELGEESSGLGSRGSVNSGKSVRSMGSRGGRRE